MPEQKVISLDATILSGLQKCARFYHYRHQKNLEPPDKAEALERGDLLHKIFEIVYGLEANIAREGSDTWRALREIGIKPATNMARADILKLALDEAPNFFAGKMSLEPSEVEETIYQSRAYFQHYENDSWETLAVEEVGSKLLHEDDELQIIYNAKIDRIARRGDLIMPWDHKTSKRRQDPSSLSNQFMGYCFHPDVEVLTPDGWVKISKLQDQDVLQWQRGGAMQFVQPLAKSVRDYNGDLVLIDGKTSSLTTPEHRFLTENMQSPGYRESTAESAPLTSGHHRIVTSGVKIDGLPGDEFLKYLVAVQADGHIRDSGAVSFHITKHRKIERLRELTKSLGIEMHENEGNVYYIPVTDKINQRAVNLLGFHKDFGSWLLDYSIEGLGAFIEELKYWDGSDRKDRGHVYFSKNQNNADWVHTIAHLVGLRASVHIQDNCYRVNISNHRNVNVLQHKRSRIPYEGQVFCVQVPSSFLLTRHNGKIMISGNCWILNSSHMLVNKVGFQKTLRPAERFQRDILTYSADRLEEWRRNTVWWVRLLLHFLEENEFPMNLTSCDKYSGCIYKNLCESSLEGRAWKEERDYTQGKAWDVASVLEVSKEQVK